MSTLTRDPLAAARSYLSRGWQPVPIPDQGGKPVKGPRRRGWESFRCTLEEAQEHFASTCNVGVLLGEPSAGLLDVDLDCPEAIDLAEWILPHTAALFGRPGKPRSHRLYRAAGSPGHTRQWELAKGHPLRRAGKDSETLLELRSTGGQTVFPGSLHEGTREPIEWAEEGEPTQVEREDLERACGRLAAGVVLLRHGWEREAVLTFLETPARDPLADLGEWAAQLGDWLGLPRTPATPATGTSAAQLSVPSTESQRLPGYEDHWRALGPAGVAKLIPELEPRQEGDRPRLEVRCPDHQGEALPQAWVALDHTPVIRCKHRGSCGHEERLSAYLIRRDRLAGDAELLQFLRESSGLGSARAAQRPEHRSSGPSPTQPATRNGSPQPRPLILRRASEIGPEPVRWLWPGMIPLGALTLLVGPPGVGKSTVLRALAAAVSTGAGLPGSRGVPGPPRAPAGVLMLVGEDHVPSVTVPSLRALGANLERVTFFEGMGDPDVPEAVTLQNAAAIADAAERAGAKLIIVDPWTAFFVGDSYKSPDVRACVQPLIRLAQSRGLALVLLGHVNKGQSQDAYRRAAGNGDMFAAARSVLLAARDPKDQDGKRGLGVLNLVKSNLGPAGAALGYRVMSHGDGAILEWGEPSSATSAELLGEARPEGGQRRAVDRAVEFLREVLADGPVSTNQLRALAKSRSISWKSVERARDDEEAAISEPTREANKISGWIWRLPGDQSSPPRADCLGGVAPAETRKLFHDKGPSTPPDPPAKHGGLAPATGRTPCPDSDHEVESNP